MQQLLVKKLEKKKNTHTHRFNMIWQIAYVHGNREEDFHYKVYMSRPLNVDL